MMDISFRPLLAGLCALPALLAQDSLGDRAHAVLAARCLGCHGSQAQGGLDLRTQAGALRAVQPGNSAASLLMARISGAKPPRMPMGGAPLTAGETELLRQWIDQGAPYPAARAAEPKWTPPLAPRQVTPPAGGAHPIDAFLPVNKPLVSDGVFARRVWLDLWGLLPTPAELKRFEDDRTEGKRDKLVARLLSHKENYAGHWMSFWNDLLRNDEGVIYHGERKSITPWLRKALEDNLPYDEFARRLISPESPSDPDGFLTGVTWRGVVSASELPPMQAAQNSAQIFLGVNLKCNSCHDSFISKWQLADAYGLASFFAPEPLEMVRCDVKTGRVQQARFLFPELGSVPEGLDLKGRRAVAADLFTKPANGRFARTYVNRIWARLLGRGLVANVDDLSAEPWNADLLDWLAMDFAGQGYDTHKLLARIMNSRAYQLPSVTEVSAGPRYRFEGPERRRLSAEQLADAVASLTGEWRPVENRATREVAYAREWRFKSSPLTRALGRPIRDQVTTVRQSQPTMLQGLELVNGATLARMLRRGAQRLMGTLPPAPKALFDSGPVRGVKMRPRCEIDLTGASKLWLLLEDYDTYDPARARAGWMAAEFVTAAGAAVPAAEAFPATRLNALPLGTELVLDLAGKGFTRFVATAAVEEASAASDVNASVRLFAFTQEPDREQLVQAAGPTPVVRPHLSLATPQLAVIHLYRHALSRDPSAAEMMLARQTIGARLTPEILEDMLWALVMSPEFQYIR